MNVAGWRFLSFQENEGWIECGTVTVGGKGKSIIDSRNVDTFDVL